MYTNNYKLLVLIMLGLTVLAFQAFAQNPKTAPQAADSTAAKTAQKPATPAPVDDGAVRMLLDKIEIEGRLEKPQAVFIIPGRNPEIDDINIERSFFNDIFRPVEKKNQTITKQNQVGTQDRKDVIPW
jgi:hypothetical protein